jgi:DNA-binding MarR family transcriptional regulator
MTAYTAFFAELVGLEIDLWNRLDRWQSEGGFASVAQLQALGALSSGDGSTRVQDVSDELQITVGAASKLIDRLERDGLAERAPHPSDRRSMVVTLTPAGRAAYEKGASAADAALTRMLAPGLSEERAAEFGRAFASLRAALGEAVAS